MPYFPPAATSTTSYTPSSIFEQNIVWHDDFLYQSGGATGSGFNTSPHWAELTSGGSSSPIFNTSSITDGHPGVQTIQTSNSGTSTSYCAIMSEQRGINFNAATGYHEVTWITSLKAKPAVGDDFVVMQGFIEQPTYGTQDYSVAFLINRGNGTTNAVTNWQCTTMNGNTTTSATFVDSGIAFDTSWHKFKIQVNKTSGHAIFYIDGVQVADISTNIPTGSGHGSAVGAIIDNNSNVGTVGHIMYLDYMYFLNALTVSR